MMPVSLAVVMKAEAREHNVPPRALLFRQDAFRDLVGTDGWGVELNADLENQIFSTLAISRPRG